MNLLIDLSKSKLSFQKPLKEGNTQVKQHSKQNLSDSPQNKKAAKESYTPQFLPNLNKCIKGCGNVLIYTFILSFLATGFVNYISILWNMS